MVGRVQVSAMQWRYFLVLSAASPNARRQLKSARTVLAAKNAHQMHVSPVDMSVFE
jgi:hypothetical protein